MTPPLPRRRRALPPPPPPPPAPPTLSARYGRGLVAVSTGSCPAWRGSTTSLAGCCQAASLFPPQARGVGRRSPGGGVWASARQRPSRPPPVPSLSLPRQRQRSARSFQQPKTVLLQRRRGASDRGQALPACLSLRVSTQASTRALAAPRRQGERRLSCHATCFLALARRWCCASRRASAGPCVFTR